MEEIAETTKFDPSQTCENYDTFRPTWEMARDFAEPHDHELSEKYLDQFSKGSTEPESTVQFNWRKRAACHIGLGPDLVDQYVTNIFRESPQRDFENSTHKDFIEQFLADVDGAGTSMDGFMRQRLLEHYAVPVDIVVEKTPVVEGVENKRQEEEAGARVYLTSYSMLARLDWGCDVAGQYNFVRYDCGLPQPTDEEAGLGPHEYVTYTPTEWRVYQVQEESSGEEGQKSVTVTRGPLATGRIPVVSLWDSVSSRREFAGVPLSLMMRLAPIERTILNTFSQAQLDMYMSVAALAISGIDKEDTPKKIGPGTLWAFDSPEAKVDMLSSSVEHIKLKLEHIKELCDIERRIGKNTSQAKDNNAKSGFHEEVIRTDLDNMLRAKAEQLAEVEQRIIALAISRETGEEVRPEDTGYTVKYNKKYVLQPLADLLTEFKLIGEGGFGEEVPEIMRIHARKVLDAVARPSNPEYDEAMDSIENAAFSVVGLKSIAETDGE